MPGMGPAELAELRINVEIVIRLSLRKRLSGFLAFDHRLQVRAKQPLGLLYLRKSRNYAAVRRQNERMLLHQQLALGVTMRNIRAQRDRVQLGSSFC